MSSSCLYGNHGPPLNTDISGIGVRISFYLQTLALACVSLRAKQFDEMAGALRTLLATNTAMLITSLIVSLRSEPEITLQDALVVFYLLLLSWLTVISSLPACYRFEGDGVTAVLKLWSILQSYLFFAFTLILLVKGLTFGSSPECNGNAVVVLFRPFPVYHVGIILGWVLTVIVVALYTFVTVGEYILWFNKVLRLKSQKVHTANAEPWRESLDAEPERMENRPPDNPRPIPTVHVRDTNSELQSLRYRPNLDGRLIIWLFVILIGWALIVLNIELLIRWNHFTPSDGNKSIWQFGQVLPLLLVVLPLSDVIMVFKRYQFYLKNE